MISWKHIIKRFRKNGQSANDVCTDSTKKENSSTNPKKGNMNNLHFLSISASMKQKNSLYLIRQDKNAMLPIHTPMTNWPFIKSTGFNSSCFTTL